MQSSMLMQILRAVLREIVLHKTIIAAAFVAISFIVLAAAFFWPKQYEAQATLYADEQNIIKPLLEGKAAVTDVDRAQEAKDLIQTRRMVEKIAKQAGILTGSESPSQYEGVLKGIQKNLKVVGLTAGNAGRTTFIRLSYTDSTAEGAYDLVNAAVNVFIRETTETKQRESSSAYQFIDGQVRTYKQQLMEAEERLKNFNADNTDGTEASANLSISQLQGEIQALRLDIDDARTRQGVLESQIGRESQYLSKRYRSDIYRERLNDAQSRLDTLMLSYTDTHPDVINLKHQIEDLKAAISDAQNNRQAATGTESNVNPLYDELRKTLTEVRLDLQSKEKRLAATEVLLVQEQERARRLATRGAELAELTRDYDVTKKMYESLLESKEKARISMTLDVQGQGVTYRIQESPIFPTDPIGLQFSHFALAGPLIGLLLPIGVIVAFIQLDPRIRFAAALEQTTNLPLLATVPHFNTRFSKRILRGDMLALGTFIVISMAVYLAICLARYLGWLG